MAGLALWAVADVLLVTSVREGLNLAPLEFMIAREARPGAIVLSEFSSLARVLSGPVLCNPWSVRKVSAAGSRVDPVWIPCGSCDGSRVDPVWIL